MKAFSIWLFLWTKFRNPLPSHSLFVIGGIRNCCAGTSHCWSCDAVIDGEGGGKKNKLSFIVFMVYELILRDELPDICIGHLFSAIKCDDIDWIILSEICWNLKCFESKKTSQKRAKHRPFKCPNNFDSFINSIIICCPLSNQRPKNVDGNLDIMWSYFEFLLSLSNTYPNLHFEFWPKLRFCVEYCSFCDLRYHCNSMVGQKRT